MLRIAGLGWSRLLHAPNCRSFNGKGSAALFSVILWNKAGRTLQTITRASTLTFCEPTQHCQMSLWHGSEDTLNESMQTWGANQPWAFPRIENPSKKHMFGWSSNTCKFSATFGHVPNIYIWLKEIQRSFPDFIYRLLKHRTMPTTVNLSLSDSPSPFFRRSHSPSHIKMMSMMSQKYSASMEIHGSPDPPGFSHTLKSTSPPSPHADHSVALPRTPIVLGSQWGPARESTAGSTPGHQV